MALTDKLTAIGDAIRSKTETEELFTLDEMAAKISEMGLGDISLSVHTKSMTSTFTELAIAVDAFPCVIFFPGCKNDGEYTPSNGKYLSNVWIIPKEDFTKEDIINYSANSAGYGRIKPTDSGISISYADNKITISSNFTIYSSTGDHAWSISTVVSKNQGE